MGDHSLEDFPIMLAKIMNKKNVSHLSRVHRNDMVNTKNIQIITRQGTHIGDDKVKRNNTVLQNHEHPNTKLQNKTFNHSTQVFKYLASQEDRLEYQSTKVNELLQLLSKESVACRLVKLLNILKEKTQIDRSIKNVCKMNNNDKSDFDPQVKLDIEGVIIP